tara:strand:+ start:640 stop:933 length:294 start_codon:yes stop_codon:yes gene_type:complete
MIKLIEVVTNPTSYNSEIGRVENDFRLRTFYVNPSFIVSMTDCEKLNTIHQTNPVVEKLVPEARFTKMAIASGVHGTTFYSVLGAPDDHIHMLKKIQ